MSYFANSAWNYLAKKIDRFDINTDKNRRVLVTIPTFPEIDTIAIGETFANKCMADTGLELTLKVAQSVYNGWTENGKATAKRFNWVDDRGNLTFYRNLPYKPDKTSIVVLVGADRTTDAGSLSDFHRCDLTAIWLEEMEETFLPWVKEKMKTIGIENIENSNLKVFDRILIPLMDNGKADLLNIGNWLNNIDLSTSETVRDALKIVLRSLEHFQLPKFTSFPIEKKQITFSPYIEKANAFYSYTMFLDDKVRDKSAKTIDKIILSISNGEDLGFSLEGADTIGSFLDGNTFLAGLKNYILTEDKTNRGQLLKCDFVTIIDKILKYKKKSPSEEKKETIRKISGSPIEMLLHAVWQTLRDFYRDNTYSDALIRQIEISSDRFKHDYDNSDEKDTIDATIDRSDLARVYLQRLIGGVDNLINQHMELLGPNNDNLTVISNLADSDVPCVYAKTAEPQLEFSIKLMCQGTGEPYRRKFSWRLPETHSYRLAESLLHWAKNAIESDSSIWKLPTYHLPYYEELLRATDDEEARRVLIHCIKDPRPEDAKFTNLLGQEWLRTEDILLEPMKTLAEKYALFVLAAYQNGLHGALFSSYWKELREAYKCVCRVVVQDSKGAESQMAAMLLRAFLIVQRRSAQLGVAWGTESFERSGIATVLHPALLEMLEAQVLFLFSCFKTACAAEMRGEDRPKAFKENIWNGFVDLASIQSPIVGLLYNEDQNLDTNVRGQDLIYRIGSPEERDATLSTRLLMRYDNINEDEQLADIEIFRESRESKLLFRLMTDYFRLHPHARDGMKIAVFRNQDIQPIIAAVHQYINKLADSKDPIYYVLKPDQRKPYAIGVTIFTESGDDVDVARWIEQWRERWEAAETEKKFQSYRYCRFSVAHRIVEAQQLYSFQKLIDDSFETDIAVLYDFIRAGQGGNRFQEVDSFDITTRTLKFPLLEKSCCTIKHPTDSYKRFRVISNRQFMLGTLHAEVMHRLKNQGLQAGKEYVILGVGDFAPWRNVIDALHSKAEWVICIDPNMDERLIKMPNNSNMKEREIIGFGSGVGSHGESNFTISTEQFSLADVHARLAASIQVVYSGSGWTVDDYQSVAKGVLAQARELSGLSLVRATGVGHHIHDFMAYSLTRKMLRENRNVLCDNMISLDAYRHWFDMADDERRPDLLWLTAWINSDNRVCLRMHLIECKAALQSDVHLLKARVQINNGLRVLVPAFSPHVQNSGAIEDANRPDQRYWWLQLHRLVTSKAEIESIQQTSVLSALERLAEGDYELEWDASVFAFWSDDTSGTVKRIGKWKPNEKKELIATIYSIGSEFVRKLAIGAPSISLTWSEWNKTVQDENGNVCDSLEDIEISSDRDDDEDIPVWDEQKDQVEHENDQGSDEIHPKPPADDLKPDKNDGSDAPAEQGPEIFVSPEDDEPVSATPYKVPDRILLGNTVNGNKPVYWEFGHPELANRHMIVFGMSGMGKTYAIQCLLSELARSGQNSLIIDYTDGFIPSKLEKVVSEFLKPKQHFIQQSPLPISPFKGQVNEEAGMIFKDTPLTIAKRVAAIFKSVYELGNQQFPVLIDAITDGVGQFGDDFSLAEMLSILEHYIGDTIHGTPTVRSTISKLKPFIQSNPFADDSNGIGWPDLFSDQESRCHVFQFFMVDKHSARALIEFVLWDLYAFVSGSGNKDLPRVVVLDEIQNLDLGPDAPVMKYLTEGRKHGLALIAATQTVKNVGGVNDARVSNLFQAGHKLFFRPTENEIKEHAQLLHNAISNVNVQEWATRLASLKKGECWSLGQSLNEVTGKLMSQAQKVKISSLEERGFNG